MLLLFSDMNSTISLENGVQTLSGVCLSQQGVLRSGAFTTREKTHIGLWILSILDYFADLHPVPTQRQQTGGRVSISLYSNIQFVSHLRPRTQVVSKSSCLSYISVLIRLSQSVVGFFLYLYVSLSVRETGTQWICLFLIPAPLSSLCKYLVCSQQSVGYDGFFFLYSTYIQTYLCCFSECRSQTCRCPTLTLWLGLIEISFLLQVKTSHDWRSQRPRCAGFLHHLFPRESRAKSWLKMAKMKGFYLSAHVVPCPVWWNDFTCGNFLQRLAARKDITQAERHWANTFHVLLNWMNKCLLADLKYRLHKSSKKWKVSHPTELAGPSGRTTFVVVVFYFLSSWVLIFSCSRHWFPVDVQLAQVARDRSRFIILWFQFALDVVLNKNTKHSLDFHVTPLVVRLHSFRLLRTLNSKLVTVGLPLQVFKLVSEIKWKGKEFLQWFLVPQKKNSLNVNIFM